MQEAVLTVSVPLLYDLLDHLAFLKDIFGGDPRIELLDRIQDEAVKLFERNPDTEVNQIEVYPDGSVRVS